MLFVLGSEFRCGFALALVTHLSAFGFEFFERYVSSLFLPENLVATERSDFFYKSEWEHIVFTIDIYLVVSQKLIISCKRIRILETSFGKNRFIEIGSRIAEELGIETTDKLLTIDIQGYLYLTGFGNRIVKQFCLN